MKRTPGKTEQTKKMSTSSLCWGLVRPWETLGRDVVEDKQESSKAEPVKLRENRELGIKKGSL